MDDLPQGLNQTDEHGVVLGPGLWRFVAGSLTFPLRVAWICHRWNSCDVLLWETVRVPLCDSFLSVLYLVVEFKIPPAFWSHLYLGGHWWVVPWPEGCSSGPTPQGCRWTGTVGLAQPQNSSQCCSAPANMRNPGLLTKVCGVSAHCGQQQPGLLQNPHLSVHLALVSRRRWPPSRQTRWMCSPFQIGCAPLTGFAALECRFPLPYLVLAKKMICFVYPCKCQKCKILKSLPKKLLSFKKRAIEIVILLSYSLMNLLSPPFSAQKWVLPGLKQRESFPFIYCSISSYQSHG